MMIINLIFTPLINFFLRYPTPGSLSYLWNFGVSSLFFLIVQIITGLFLSMHYVPNEMFAFESVEDIMRNISYGWLFRYMHSNGASFFFICVYAHVFRNIYYLSFLKPRQWVWYSGVVILILMIATAFTGYVLPWGQMSYWAATVITNLFSVIPYCGNEVVVWLWGDYGVTTSTLNRFYTIHFILPFLILVVACLHIFVLHRKGSTSKIGLTLENGKIMFHPFFTFKDFVFLVIVIMIFLAVVGFAPNYLGHPDNYIPADPLVTPSHIVPEWYFLPFYAMLRCVPNKSLGVIVLACSLLQLFLLPSLHPNANVVNAKIATRETLFNKVDGYQLMVKRKDDETARVIFFGFRVYIVLFWIFLIDCILLGVLGSKSLENPYVKTSLICTIFYFLFFYLSSFLFSEKGSKLLIFILNTIENISPYLTREIIREKFDDYVDLLLEKIIDLKKKKKIYYRILKYLALPIKLLIEFYKKHKKPTFLDQLSQIDRILEKEKIKEIRRKKNGF